MTGEYSDRSTLKSTVIVWASSQRPGELRVVGRKQVISEGRKGERRFDMEFTGVDYSQSGLNLGRPFLHLKEYEKIQSFKKEHRLNLVRTPFVQTKDNQMRGCVPRHPFRVLTTSQDYVGDEIVG